MGSQWLKIQDRSFASEFKNIGLKVRSCAINHVINGGWAWSPAMRGYSIVLQGRLMGSFLGTPALIGPWGCPAALPRRQGLTDSSNEACHRRARDRSRAGTELQSACVTSKEFWFLSSGEGVKRRPLWEIGSPGLPLNISPFTACQFSVLETHSGEAGRGWLWWIFHKQKEKEEKKKKEKGAHSPMGLGLSYEMSLCEAVIVPELLLFSK